MVTKTKNLVRLKCQECSSVNYYVWKKKGVDWKLNLRKFCQSCRKHTKHKEAKK